MRAKTLLVPTCLAMLNINGFAQETTSHLPIVSVDNTRQEKISPSLWVSGDVITPRQARISAEQSGRLNWLAEIGDSITQGQTIARIDSRQLTLQLAEKQSEQQQQQANTQFLQKQKQRFEALVEMRSTAQTEFDRVVRDLQVSIAQEKVLSKQIEQIQLSLEKSTIKAPFSGEVVQRFAQPGEFVSQAAPILQLVDPRQTNARIMAPLQVAPYLKKGESLNLRWNEQLLTAPIKSWSATGDYISRTFELRLDTSGLNIMSGSAVSVALPSALPQEHLLVPRDALLLRQDDIYVVTVDPENKAQKISVSTGQGLGNWIAIQGNLKPGDKVVIRGGENLKTGDSVKIVDFTDKVALEN